ncbi:MAG: von Willebrand factor type A domain-containing protein, partial [Gemmatimonadetes bacterium]|nr:von Willebrand factor type A domain-containing protein [Gemmatimonadota bacterium]
MKTSGIVFAALALATSSFPREAPPPQVAVAVSVTGQVTDVATGQALSGAQVIVDGGQRGAVTNASGHYVIALGESWVGREVTLRAQLIGYTTVSRTVKLTAGANVVSFALAVTPVALSETVVTGVTQDAARRVSPEMAKMQVASSAAAPWPGGVLMRARRPDFNTESYATIDENGWKTATAEPLSTFSIDVDRASYANVRRFIRQGTLPPVDAVRIEELINYFTYDDPEPKGDVPFSINTEVAPAPWQPLHRLVRIGLKGRSVDLKDIPPSNLVFLVDVSGSMQPPDKLPLLKTALGMLVDELRPQDRVAIVVYAGAAGLVLPSTPGSHKR